MSKKDKRREALRLGKKDMSFAEIMQAIGACRADDCDKCLLNGGPIAGWFPEDVPDCYTVLLKNAEKQLCRTGNWWRWDDIFRVYRCPFCGGDVEETGGSCNFGKKIMTLNVKCRKCGTSVALKTAWNTNAYIEAVEAWNRSVNHA